MPVVGQRKTTDLSSYDTHPMRALAEAFCKLNRNMLVNEGTDLFESPVRSLNRQSTNDAVKEFFIENSMPNEDEASASVLEDHVQMMEALYENTREAIMNEAAPSGTYSPVVGMTFPLHKNLLMNAVFDKALPKVVSQSPIFTQTMETRILETPDGEQIDIWKDQNKIYDAMESTAPFIDYAVKLPEFNQLDILTQMKAPMAPNGASHNALSIATHISAIAVETWVAKDEMKISNVDGITTDGKLPAEEKEDKGAKGVKWIPVNLKFVPAYGEYDRTMMEEVQFKKSENGQTFTTEKAIIQGFMKDNKFGISCLSGNVKAVKICAKLDTSSAMVKTCLVKWKTTTTPTEIPAANPINTYVSPEEVKDVQALYNVSQTTKIMAMINDILGQYRDDKIHRFLDYSFTRLPDEARISSAFDFAPREGYFDTHIDWREKTFMDYLDTVVTSLLQVLNDPNMTITVIGRPDIIRKITPTTSYSSIQTTPAEVGPIQLDYVKTVVTSGKRVYQFLSSDKLRGNDNLIILLNPRNTNRIIYQIVDYQFYVSNEIRNTVNYALPSVHAFDRFITMEYQGVQGRVKILNPTGLKTPVVNDDPIGISARNDAMGLNAPFIQVPGK